MNMLVINIIEVGLIGCLVFTCLVIFFSYTGIASEMRDEEGNFKKRRNLKTVLGVILFISFLIGLLYLGNLRLLDSSSESPAILLLWANSFGIFFIIHLYDLIVLDYLVIVKWHPKFLKLPETDYYRTFGPHFKGFIKGIPIGIGASFIITIITVVTN